MITIAKVKGKNARTKQVTVYKLTDNTDRFEVGSALYCHGVTYEVVHSKPKGQKEFTIELTPSPDLVVVGSELKVPYESAPILEEGTFYHEDLVGMKVFDEGNYLGKITNIIETGSNDVYVVTYANSEILIPSIKSVIKHVDILKQTMFVNLPKGL
tara:strand:+ start:14356 stop:14823 length:468 start_codon:yes stop_codon:yes gene_type:complete